jgi:hypothetical protein
MARSDGGRLRVTLWPESYAVARLRAVPADLPVDPAGPPVGVIVGGGEVSLLAPEVVVDRPDVAVEHVSRGWRAITLDLVLPLDTVGVMATIGRALADVGVPVMVLSSHDTDHFLVPGDLLGRALAALGQTRLDRILASPK